MMQISGALPDLSVVRPSVGGSRSIISRRCGSSFEANFYTYIGLPPKNSFLSNSKIEVGPEKLRTRSFVVRASGTSGENLIPVAPLELESPVGQLLSQVLQTHPHLLSATAEQQLENLQSQRNDEKNTSSPSSSNLRTKLSSDDVLYKRIAEFKEKERRNVLEEIMYCLIVQKFLDNDISMIPKISKTSDPAGRVDFWPNQEQKLESVHSPEAFEMIVSHLALVLGERMVGPLYTVAEISKIKLGKLYAASIMYGYFLRRVDERYQLDRSMNSLPKGFSEDPVRFQGLSPGKQLWDLKSLIRIYPEDNNLGDTADPSSEEKLHKLKSYVMCLDAETLQRYATMRSKEAISIIEKQTQALFGRPDITVSKDGSLDASNDETVSLTFSGLTMLVLEAVAFGSFLWDTETFVESKYPFLSG